MEAALYSLRSHPQTAEPISTLLLSVFSNRMEELLPTLRHFAGKQFLPFAAELLPFLKNPHLYASFEDLLVEFTPELENPKITQEHRSLVLSFLVETWFLEPKIVQGCQTPIDGLSLSEYSLKMLGKACRDKSISLRLSSLALVFKLLSHFAELKNPHAPLIYKSLTFSLLENFSDDVTREFILSNLASIFETVPSIPVAIAVEPLVKQMQNSSDLLNVFDFEFLLTVAEHPKLQQTQAIQILDLMAKVYLSQPLWA